MTTATGNATGTTKGAHRIMVNALVRLGAAYRNRTDDLFITRASDRRTQRIAKIRFACSDGLSGPSRTTVTLPELQREMQRGRSPPIKARWVNLTHLTAAQ
jgi:hypothetical protein